MLPSVVNATSDLRSLVRRIRDGLLDAPDSVCLERARRRAMAIAVRAVVDWAGRYAEAADGAASRASDPAIRALREARAHPERHRDLVVRIAGLSAVFVTLSRLEQDEMIARAEDCAACAPGVRAETS